MHPELEKYYVNTRRIRAAELIKRQEECAAKNARFAQIFAAKSKLLSQGLPIADTRLRLQQLQSDLELLLLQNDLPKNFLEPLYSCPYCEDTGYVGDPVRQPCSCHMLLLQQHLADGARINREETFENFDEDIYPSDQQLKTALNAKKRCERYANALPAPSPPNLLILGQSGLGKSFLGNAIAARALEAGVSALRTAAYRFISDIMDGISERKSRLSAYVEAGLLVLDDLGTEFMTQFSHSVLYNIINTRLIELRPTIISTNLRIGEIEEKYSQRMVSRLVCGYRVMEFFGKDIRMAKMTERNER